jgi:hypothetical protein
MLNVVEQEVPHRSEEKRPEPASLTASGVDGLLLQEAREERLRQILRLLSRIPLPPHVGVQRVPVDLTECRQGCSRLWRRGAASRQHHAPTGGLEAPTNIGSHRDAEDGSATGASCATVMNPVTDVGDQVGIEYYPRDSWLGVYLQLPQNDLPWSLRPDAGVGLDPIGRIATCSLAAWSGQTGHCPAARCLPGPRHHPDRDTGPFTR